MRIPTSEVDDYFVMEDAMGTSQRDFEVARERLDEAFPWLKRMDAVLKTDVLVALSTRLL